MPHGLIIPKPPLLKAQCQKVTPYIAQLLIKARCLLEKSLRSLRLRGDLV